MKVRSSASKALLLVAALIGIGLGAPAAAKDGLQVLILHSGAADALGDETLTRMRGELEGEGFAVTFQVPVRGLPWLRAMAEAAEAQKPAAVVALDTRTQPGIATLYVLDTTTGHQQTHTFDIGQLAPARAASVLAVRATEALRQAMEGLATRAIAQRTQQAPPPAAPAAAATTAALPQNHFQLGFGAQVLAPTGGVSALLTPALTVTIQRQSLLLRLDGAGFGSTGTIVAPQGEGRVSLLRISAWGGVQRKLLGDLRGHALIGAGLFRIGIEGIPSVPGATGTSDSAAVPAAAVSVGAHLPITGNFWLGAEAGIHRLMGNTELAVTDQFVAELGPTVLTAGLTVNYQFRQEQP